MFPEFSLSKILIHVAFHFVEKRLGYLTSVMKEFDTYDFSEMTVAIDTNTADTIPYVERISSKLRYKPEVCVHEKLDHPFNLTWTHRQNMASRLQDYEYFMYLEDDILIPYAAMQRWKYDSQKIYNHGYIRGFLRIEKTEDGTLTSVDHRKRIRNPRIIRIDEVDYVQPNNPYSACWIYDSQQMRDFVNSPCWQRGHSYIPAARTGGIREEAAFGMTWSNPHGHRTLIPISTNRQPLKDAFVYHLPNNYALDSTSRFGKIPAHNLLSPYTGFWSYLSNPLGELRETKAGILEALNEGSFWLRVKRRFL